jgi:hypothetical protein
MHIEGRAKRGSFSLLAGISLGLLIAALLSADFWKVNRHYRFWYGLTNRSSQPLAGNKNSP